MLNQPCPSEPAGRLPSASRTMSSVWTMKSTSPHSVIFAQISANASLSAVTAEPAGRMSRISAGVTSAFVASASTTPSGFSARAASARSRRLSACDAVAFMMTSRGRGDAGARPVFVNDDVEAFEMRAGKVFDLGTVRIAGPGMGGAELVGLRPGLEMLGGLPDRVGSVKGVIFGLGALQHVKLDIARHLGKATFAAAPQGLEGFFMARHDAEAVHRNIHSPLSSRKLLSPSKISASKCLERRRSLS